MGDWRTSRKNIKDRLKYVLTHEDTEQDVAFVVGKVKSKIMAHSFVLYLASKEFANLLKAQKAKCDDKIIEIECPDVDPEAFRYLLQHVYIDVVEFESLHTLDVLHAAKKFNLVNLVQSCVSKLKTEIDTENAIKIYEESTKMLVNDLTETARLFILRNAEQVFRTPEFNDITYQNLCGIIASDDLNLDEVSIFQAVITWGKTECKRFQSEEDGQNLRYVLKNLVELIRFPLMTMEQFTINVVPTKILHEKEIIDLYKYFSLGNSLNNTKEISSTSFLCSRRVDRFTPTTATNTATSIQVSQAAADESIRKSYSTSNNTATSGKISLPSLDQIVAMQSSDIHLDFDHLASASLELFVVSRFWPASNIPQMNKDLGHINKSAVPEFGGCKEETFRFSVNKRLQLYGFLCDLPCNAKFISKIAMCYDKAQKMGATEIGNRTTFEILPLTDMKSFASVTCDQLYVYYDKPVTVIPNNTYTATVIIYDGKSQQASGYYYPHQSEVQDVLLLPNVEVDCEQNGGFSNKVIFTFPDAKTQREKSSPLISGILFSLNIRKSIS